MMMPISTCRTASLIALIWILSVTGVQGQADGPATCVKTWQLTGDEDLLQACQEPSSAVNVVFENSGLINVFGGGGDYQLIEGKDTVTESVIVPIIESFGRASILAVVVEDNRQGTIDVQKNNNGPNDECRDNSSGNNLVTVAATTVTGTMNAFANGGAVILALMRNSGGTVTGARRRELAEENARLLQQCDENAEGFEAICWWMFLLRKAGRPDGTLTCERDFTCEPNPCPPVERLATDSPSAEDDVVPPDDDERCDMECCIELLGMGCNCGLFDRGDPCWWDIAKRSCFNKPMQTMMESRKKFRKRLMKAKNKFRREVKREYKSWCVQQVEDGKFEEGEEGAENPFDNRRKRRRTQAKVTMRASGIIKTKRARKTPASSMKKLQKKYPTPTRIQASMAQVA